MSRKVQFLYVPESIKGKRIPSDLKEDILNEVADYLVESILDKVGEEKSPVTGRQFKKLSEQYKKRKKAEGSGTKANLQLEGDLLDSLIAEVDKGKIKITVSENQQPKADGHNNFSGKSLLPRRPFIPDAQRNETFTKDIRDGANDIAMEYLKDYGYETD